MITLKNINPDKLIGINFLIPVLQGNPSLVLAGGALRSLVDPNDIIIDYDLYMIGTRRFVNSIKPFIVTHLLNRFPLSRSCPNGKLYHFKHEDYPEIQLIDVETNESIEQLLENFDITACRLAFDGYNLYTYKDTIDDIKNKRLKLHHIDWPPRTMRRIFKYKEKGYKSNTIEEEFYEMVKVGNFDQRNFENYRPAERTIGVRTVQQAVPDPLPLAYELLHEEDDLPW